jgi:hypothetical protein
MVNAELLIEIALESHPERLRRAEQERIASCIAAARARNPAARAPAPIRPRSRGPKKGGLKWNASHALSSGEHGRSS